MRAGLADHVFYRFDYRAVWPIDELFKSIVTSGHQLQRDLWRKQHINRQRFPMLIDKGHFVGTYRAYV